MKPRQGQGHSALADNGQLAPFEAKHGYVYCDAIQKTNRRMFRRLSYQPPLGMLAIRKMMKDMFNS